MPAGVPLRIPAINATRSTVSAECKAWHTRWWDIDGGVDGDESGVWADWLEDHPEQCQPDAARDRLVAYLRKRFADPKHHQSL